MQRLSVALALVAGLLASTVAVAAPGPAPKPAAVSVSDATVSKAIASAVRYLYSVANKQGHWDEVKEPDLKTKRGGYPPDRKWGGKTALVLYALATAGQQSDPRFKKALAWLVAQEMVDTYAVSLRLQLIHQLITADAYRELVKRDARHIVLGARQMPGGGAKWDYVPPPGGNAARSCDFSCANYAVLALWAATDERFEVSARLWRALEKTYCLGQNADGGWSYYPSDQTRPGRGAHYTSTGSMTTAGVASLYLIIDRTYARQGGLGAFRKSKAYESIQKGLAWMAKRFSPSVNTGRPRWFETYYFYNCERVGAAAGLKYFGTHDWFRGIAGSLLKRQRSNGSIPYSIAPQHGGVVADTAFALLFLTKGSAPVIFNKLRHAGDWDNHIRELSGLTDWLARQSERPANWQVVNLKVPAEDLTDSRILYIAGLKPLKFQAEEKAKLKRFVELGGLLVFHPDGGSIGFQHSIVKLLGELWPKLELSPVDLSRHPIGKIYVPLRGARLQELSSATRVFALVVHGAPANAWERRQFATAKHYFDLGAALHYFANDRAPLRKMPTKLTYFAEAFRQELPIPTRAVLLGRIKHCEDCHRWDPEPLAMERFARMLRAAEKVNCRVKVVTPDQLAAAGVKVAHLTGVGAAELGAQWEAIDAWVRKGGTLLVDQAGGPRQDAEGSFDAGFRKLIAARYGEGALGLLSSSHPLVRGLEKVVYRNVPGMRRKSMRPRLECVKLGDRVAIIYSKYDLTCGLLGNPNPLVAGADGPGAYKIFSRLVLGSYGLSTQDSARKEK